MTTNPSRFGLSTHLFHGERLTEHHLARMASHGFPLVEVFATRSHFDYHDPHAVADVRRWMESCRSHRMERARPHLRELRGRRLGTRLLERDH